MTQPVPTRPELLRLENISKTFPGVKALDEVHLDLRHNEVLGLCGENGAGKSTLMKILTGVYTADPGGEIFINGARATVTGPRNAQEQGISIIHQELNLVPDMTVAQNIYMGREPKKGFVLNDSAMVRQATELLNRLAIDVNPKAYIRDLTVARQQMVEIAKALSFDCKILVMDEPTAALTDSEIETLMGLIRNFVSPETGMVYISHRMDEISEITDRITVLRDGKYVDTVVTNDTPIRDVIALMVGREIVTDIRPEPKNFDDAEVVLRVDKLSTRDLVKDVTFDLRRGEILGVAGLMGAGRTELARAIVGADPKTAGQIWVHGAQANLKSPADAVNRGIGYLSEDRKQFGLLLDMDVKANTALASLSNKYSQAGFIKESAIADDAKAQVKRLNVKTPSINQIIRNLSGGNQQKVIIGKWLVRDCDILIVDEPTRGIDIGAKDEIYALLDELCALGKSLIVISSELPEVLRICDRIAVMCNGRMTGILDNADASQESIMELATKFRDNSQPNTNPTNDDHQEVA
ncbi:sugar ABC transporter ATP-binding protein [Corynebacterium felinum]|uniref:Ribose transport system ATP-binding protein n=1 Tax=Corynebacterium felinum TaxID=131318 RepID=A0ABU2B7R1_9CORY|nr:sugar ABC transporter ATP-binding protein [Corynebacterium felinum]MDF5821600.1 sugar ABC transporter ATP-binding protein [Corynebacterium felinum]MDR7354646.1 ribose transport system ATP-binding protein [Corynebacterium felinum]WJY94011.1 Ribose import ATP-binding protein RbsA [Corynebacterium felinum]